MYSTPPMSLINVNVLGKTLNVVIVIMPAQHENLPVRKDMENKFGRNTYKNL